MTARSTTARRRASIRGGPLVMLVLLLTGWSAARAVWWENPFAPLPADLHLPHDLPLVAANPAASAHVLPSSDTPAALSEREQRAGLRLARPGWRFDAQRIGGDPRLAAAQQLLLHAALRAPVARIAGAGARAENAPWLAAAPFLPSAAPGSPRVAAGGRWTLDAWAFWRQGSDAAPISQGRVPIYGASQMGAVLQYRLGPGSRHDPRLYARAYRALVSRGESELALGASARPFGRVPLRLAGEVRYTDGAFADTVRPAAYVVTELAPVVLPYGAQLEAYGQAGWAGGPDPTGFADGQASVTSELRKVAGLTDNALHLSLGAAAWGGAQKDAQRLDIGPTLRLDVTLGEVPARLSVDWRERVAGDAGPDSGLAATLSTSF